MAAIMIGALTIQGLTPGPMLFQQNKVLVYTIFLGMFVANTIMVLLGFQLHPSVHQSGYLGPDPGTHGGKNFRTALLKSGGDVSVFFNTPICWFFILIFVTLFGGTLKRLIFSRHKAG